MRGNLPIRPLPIAMIVVMMMWWGSSAHGQAFNPLRSDTIYDDEVLTSAFSNEPFHNTLQPVVWQTEDAPLAEPEELVPAKPAFPPQANEPWEGESWAAEGGLEDNGPLEVTPQDGHWPDEEYGYDPNLQRGPIRRGAAGLKRMIAFATGIGLDQTGRYAGPGSPLTNTSWLNRPWSFGAFLGTQMHDDLIQGQIGQSNSAVAGARLGWDFSYYWGLEGRFAYSNPDIFIPGIPAVIGSSHNYYVDLNLMYYPWGDSRWRPYFSAGLGSGTYRFRDDVISVSDSGLRIPLAVGLKYFYAPWFTLRFDAQFAPTFNSGNFDPQNEFMLNFGAEVRFGGRRQSYFPWHSGTVFW